MQVDRVRVSSAFAEYVAAYDMTDGKIALKAEHTLRVAELCDGIAVSLGLPAAEQDVAWLCGMLHDIGRFEQVRRWGTFFDSQSVNHAEFGADLLFCEGLIARFVDGCDPAVEVAIRNHNRLRVEPDLLPRTQTLCDILRDADKIDILRVNVERPAQEIYGAALPEIMTGDITPAVEQDFYACHCVDRAHMVTLLDRRVGHLCFVYELVYPWSLQQMVAQGYLAQALSEASANPATEAKLSRMRAFLNSWISQR